MPLPGNPEDYRKVRFRISTVWSLYVHVAHLFQICGTAEVKKLRHTLLAYDSKGKSFIVTDAAFSAGHGPPTYEGLELDAGKILDTIGVSQSDLATLPYVTGLNSKAPYKNLSAEKLPSPLPVAGPQGSPVTTVALVATQAYNQKLQEKLKSAMEEVKRSRNHLLANPPAKPSPLLAHTRIFTDPDARRLKSKKKKTGD